MLVVLDLDIHQHELTKKTTKIGSSQMRTTLIRGEPWIKWSILWILFSNYANLIELCLFVFSYATHNIQMTFNTTFNFVMRVQAIKTIFFK